MSIDTDFDPARLSYVSSFEHVRQRHPDPMSRATGKVLARLDKHCIAILERSTFCVISTEGPEGGDVSPRGDPPGFCRALDGHHLLLPDRVGNNRFDTVRNLFHNPTVGLLFLVPGFSEILRVNGEARVTDDSALLALCAHQGRAPKIGILIKVKEAFLHCAKAVNRAGLWDPTRHVSRNELPSYSQMLKDQVVGLTCEENERQSAELARRGLY